jgi:hypothetical protein
MSGKFDIVAMLSYSMSGKPDMEWLMAFREKLAWITLVSISLVFGVYGASLISPDVARLIGPTPGVRLLGAVFAEVLIVTVLTIMAAVTAPSEANAPEDERERVFSLKSDRAGYYLLSGLLWCVLMAGVFQHLSTDDILKLVFWSMIAVEIIRQARLIIAYRRGA